MKRKPSGPLILSIGLHIVLVVGLVWVMAVPMPFQKWLNEHKNVSEQTRLKVRAAIAELGYRPDRAARALVKGQKI